MNSSFLTLQWHITDRCNLSCKHCYQELPRRIEPGFEQLHEILDQYIDLLTHLGSVRKTKVRGHINITGGEPFLRDDFLALLTQIKKRRLSFAILSNGTLIDLPTARYLKSLGTKYVQVSIEGTRKTHDSIRGKGTFNKTTEALRLLNSLGVTTLVSFTAHKNNYKEFPDVAKKCRELGVNRLWADRLIPSGQGQGLADDMLNPDETFSFFRLMHRCCEPKKKLWKRAHTLIAMHRALQFQVSGGTVYHCRAGSELITIMPDGEVYPCRRLPVSVGNVEEQNLTKIYQESPILKKLREPGQICTGCEQCEHQRECRGGLRCLSYIVTGDPFRADPGCRLSSAPTATSPATSSTSASS